jgi:5-methylcytosine-specific restriction endonuclease McrA
MTVPTSPNPVYVSRIRVRKGCVDITAWQSALVQIGYTALPANASDARRIFNRCRQAYWSQRLRLSVPNEFNAYNVARMRIGKPPIGPDSFPMELDHRIELSRDPSRALEPTNIWELFRRQHDFQHGYAMRWHLGSFPQSPHTANLSKEFGDPLLQKYWP